MDIGFFSEQAIKSAQVAQRQKSFGLKIRWVCTAAEFARQAKLVRESKEDIWHALEAIGQACQRPKDTAWIDQAAAHDFNDES